MRRFDFKRRKGGFTLIELLIVIAIILILIAIALPNFLEAQIRARVTKAKGELRSVATALMSYRLDWNLYPARGDQDYADPTVPRRQNGIRWLTSPVAYITSLPDDPFPVTYRFDTGQNISGPYTYWLTGVTQPPGANLLHPHDAAIGIRAWLIASAGPDSPEVEVSSGNVCMAFNDDPEGYFSYSATNGTKSRGDIILMGGEARWMGVRLDDRGCQGFVTYLQAGAEGVLYDGVRYFHRFPDGLTMGI